MCVMKKKKGVREKTIGRVNECVFMCVCERERERRRYI
jgi:hypothetical protein